MKDLTRRDVLMAGGAVALLSSVAVSRPVYAQDGKRRRRVRVQSSFDDGWLLTEEDRAEYAAGDELVQSRVLDLRDGVDIPGGDARAFRASGLQDCVDACASDSSCEAFTFAKSTHPSARKRRMCWIKNGDTKTPVTGVDIYVSGIKRGG